MIADDRDLLNLVEWQPIGPQSRAEIPGPKYQRNSPSPTSTVSDGNRTAVPIIMTISATDTGHCPPRHASAAPNPPASKHAIRINVPGCV
jgi:hypothetical protein